MRRCDLDLRPDLQNNCRCRGSQVVSRPYLTSYNKRRRGIPMRIDRMEFVSHCNYGHILRRIWDKARFWSKIAIFLTPVIITPGDNGCDIFALFFNRARSEAHQVCCVKILQKRLYLTAEWMWEGGRAEKERMHASLWLSTPPWLGKILYPSLMDVILVLYISPVVQRHVEHAVAVWCPRKSDVEEIKTRELRTAKRPTWLFDVPAVASIKRTCPLCRLFHFCTGMHLAQQEISCWHIMDLTSHTWCWPTAIGLARIGLPCWVLGLPPAGIGTVYSGTDNVKT